MKVEQMQLVNLTQQNEKFSYCRATTLVNQITLCILNIRGALSFPCVRIWTAEPSQGCR